MKRILIIIICVAFAVIIVGCASSKEIIKEGGPSFYAVFSTSVYSKNGYPRPINTIDEITLDEEVIWFFVDISDAIPNQIYSGEVKVIGPDGKIITQGFVDIGYPVDNFYFWIYHVINLSRDLPGEWLFEFYIDGKKVLTKTLLVKKH